MSHEDIDITIKASGHVVPLAEGPCPECDYPVARYNTAFGITLHVAGEGSELCPELAELSEGVRARLESLPNATLSVGGSWQPDSSDSWEARMAARAQVRAASAERDEALAHLSAVAGRRLTEAEGADLLGRVAAFVEARGDGYAELWSGEHLGHLVHTHEVHGNGYTCTCGALMGVFTIVIPEDYVFPEGQACPVCRDWPDEKEKLCQG